MNGSAVYDEELLLSKPILLESLSLRLPLIGIAKEARVVVMLAWLTRAGLA